MYVAWNVVLHFVLDEMIITRFPASSFLFFLFLKGQKGSPRANFPGGGGVMVKIPNDVQDIITTRNTAKKES